MPVMRSYSPGWWATFALAIGLLVAWRCVNLGADPPTSFIPSDIGYHVDEGYKTLTAKNVVLFGEQNWNDADRYPPRLERSPVTDGFYALSFAILGVDRLSARLVTVGFAVAFLILLAVFLKARYPPSIALAGVVLLGVDQGLFHFSRVGLVETALCFFVYAGILGVTHFLPDRWPAALFVGTTAAIVAFGVKASALVYLAPPLAALGIVEMLSHRRGGKTHRAGARTWIPVALLGFVVVWLFWMAWTDGAQRFDAGILLAEPERLVFHPIYLVSPFALGLAYLALLDIYLRNGLRVVLENRYLVMISTIAVGTPIILSLISHNPPRYYLPIVPAALLVSVEWLHLWRNGRLGPSYRLTPVRGAVAAIAALPVAAAILSFGGLYLVALVPFIPQGADPGLSFPTLVELYPIGLAGLGISAVLAARSGLLSTTLTTVLATGLIAHALVSVGTNLRTVLEPTYATAAVERRLIELLPEGTSVGGDWAPYLTLGTGIPSLYMTRHWNTGNEIRALRPTHFLHSQTPWDSLNARRLNAQEGVRMDAPVVVGNVFARDIALHRIHYESVMSGGSDGDNVYRISGGAP